MTDLSSTLDGLLAKHNARLSQHRRSITHITDEFLKDAYQIQSHISSLYNYLLSIRAPYLSNSTAPPRGHAGKRHSGANGNRKSSQEHHHQQQQVYLTAVQRESIDAESKATLRDLGNAIGRLAATEAQRQEIRRQLAAQRAAKRFPLGALGRWAAGDGAVDKPVLTPEEKEEEDRERTTDRWRDGVLWYLRKRLGDTAGIQADMMERRIARELEKSRSVLYKVKGPRPSAADAFSDRPDIMDSSRMNGSATAKGLTLDSSGQAPSKDEDYGLTPEQLSLFAEENSAMLKHYEDSLDQVRAAEQSMVEISELQTTLAQNLAIQAERIDVMVEDSQRTEENVTGGNKQLKQASERWRPAKMMFWATCGISGALVFWDLVV